MIHTLQLAVAGPAALDFCAQRLESHCVDSTRTDESLGLADPDGLALECTASSAGSAGPTIAPRMPVPREPGPCITSRGTLRMPGGVLFEIATTSPGFAVDEDPDHRGEELRLPRQHEPLRSQLEQILTPVGNPRARV